MICSIAFLPVFAEHDFAKDVLFETAVQAVVKRAAEEEALNAFEVEITFVDDAFMQELNKEYRDMDKTTDVLSFPANTLTQPWQNEIAAGLVPEPGEEGAYLGELYISLPQAARQAEEYGNTEQEEILFLVAHGMLHLLGYDHETSEEEAAMRQKQRIILNRTKGEIE
ncbi:MAG: rRNA maturation RNase YbeY [Christensenellaceae bacterium]|jgi:probable rRNA maturation factor